MKRYAEKLATLEILESVMERLDALEKDHAYEYKCVKETVTDEQKKSWKTGELLFNEDGTPIYVVDREYDYVKKPELEEEDKVFIAAIEKVRKALDKLA